MSRMDRYYKNNSNMTRRTARNQELYKNIYEDGEYSNIEGIATIEKSNEIDITKIKNMLKNREDFQKQKEFRNFTPKEIEEPRFETFERDEDRVYDIRDILNKAKTNKEEQKYHNLDEANLDMLKQLKERTKEVKPKDDLEGIIDTITNTSKLNKLSDQELGLDMFEDLKSEHNTVISDRDSVKAILEEAKKNEENKNVNTDTGLDRSFFTSSMSFKDEDFEQIAQLNKNVKKNNRLIKILFAIILLAVTIGIVVLVFNLLK